MGDALFRLADSDEHAVAVFAGQLAVSGLFREWGGGVPTTDPVEFAASTLRIALSPDLSPGYLRIDPRVTATALRWDLDLVDLAIDVTFPARPSGPLRPAARTWETWQVDQGRWAAPDTTRPVILPTVTVRIPIPARLLSHPSYRPDGAPRPDVARSTLASVVGECNHTLAPVLAALDTGVVVNRADRLAALNTTDVYAMPIDTPAARTAFWQATADLHHEFAELYRDASAAHAPGSLDWWALHDALRHREHLAAEADAALATEAGDR